jgi:hypothetical protein
MTAAVVFRSESRHADTFTGLEDAGSATLRQQAASGGSGGGMGQRPVVQEPGSVPAAVTVARRRADAIIEVRH